MVRIDRSTPPRASAVCRPCEKRGPVDTDAVQDRYLLAWALALSACATVDPQCQQEIDACMKRCEASGGNEVTHEHLSPEQSMTYCEERCQKCRGSTTPPPPSSSPPTHTGSAKP